MERLSQGASVNKILELGCWRWLQSSNSFSSGLPSDLWVNPRKNKQIYTSSKKYYSANPLFYIHYLSIKNVIYIYIIFQLYYYKIISNFLVCKEMFLTYSLHCAPVTWALRHAHRLFLKMNEYKQQNSDQFFTLLKYFLNKKKTFAHSCSLASWS